MKKFPQKDILLILIILLVGLVGFGYYQYSKLKNENATFEAKILKLEDILGITEQQKAFLSEELTAEKNKIGTLVEQVEGIALTVGDLYKLSKTDEELLQKYSKVYFLLELRPTRFTLLIYFLLLLAQLSRKPTVLLKIGLPSLESTESTQ